MTVAIWAALAMVCTDVLSVVLVQAEAANRGWLAGICDTACWYVGIATTTISVSTLDGHNTAAKIWVLVLVGIANLLGTKLGQVTGKRLLKRFPAAPDPQTTALERQPN